MLWVKTPVRTALTAALRYGKALNRSDELHGLLRALLEDGHSAHGLVKIRRALVESLTSGDHEGALKGASSRGRARDAATRIRLLRCLEDWRTLATTLLDAANAGEDVSLIA